MADMGVLRVGLPIAAFGFEPGSQEDVYLRAIDLDRDAHVSVRELQQYDNNPANIARVRLGTIMAVEQRMRAISPPLANRHRDLARSLVERGGSATQADVDVIVRELVRLPIRVLVGMQRAGVAVVVCRDNVTDYVAELRGVQPRGWAENQTFAMVPGMLHGKKIVVSTIDAGLVDEKNAGQRRLPPQNFQWPTGDGTDNKTGHGSYNLFWHEWGHALNAYFFAGYHDQSDIEDACIRPRRGTQSTPEPEPAPTPQEFGEASGTHAQNFATEAISSRLRAFLEARLKDWDKLGPYYQQGGRGPSPGADELFVESMARYFGGDRELKADWPALFDFWDSNPFANSSLRAMAAREHGCLSPRIAAGDPTS